MSLLNSLKTNKVCSVIIAPASHTTDIDTAMQECLFTDDAYVNRYVFKVAGIL